MCMFHLSIIWRGAFPSLEWHWTHRDRMSRVVFGDKRARVTPHLSVIIGHNPRYLSVIIDLKAPSGCVFLAHSELDRDAGMLTCKNRRKNSLQRAWKECQCLVTNATDDCFSVGHTVIHIMPNVCVFLIKVQNERCVPWQALAVSYTVHTAAPLFTVFLSRYACPQPIVQAVPHMLLQGRCSSYWTMVRTGEADLLDMAWRCMDGWHWCAGSGVC